MCAPAAAAMKRGERRESAGGVDLCCVLWMTILPWKSEREGFLGGIGVSHVDAGV